MSPSDLPYARTLTVLDTAAGADRHPLHLPNRVLLDDEDITHWLLRPGTWGAGADDAERQTYTPWPSITVDLRPELLVTLLVDHAAVVIDRHKDGRTLSVRLADRELLTPVDPVRWLHWAPCSATSVTGSPATGLLGVWVRFFVAELHFLPGLPTGGPGGSAPV